MYRYAHLNFILCMELHILYGLMNVGYVYTVHIASAWLLQQCLEVHMNPQQKTQKFLDTGLYCASSVW